MQTSCSSRNDLYYGFPLFSIPLAPAMLPVNASTGRNLSKDCFQPQLKKELGMKRGDKRKGREGIKRVKEWEIKNRGEQKQQRQETKDRDREIKISGGEEWKYRLAPSL